MQEINVCEEFSEQGYDVILISSYTANLIFFERFILRHLIENDCSYIGLFIDSKELQNSFLHSSAITQLGLSYAVRGVDLDGAFHPKVYFMLGKEKAKLIIGSGNLTTSGMIMNIEVFNTFKYEVGKPDNLSLVNDAYDMFKIYNNAYQSNAMNSIFEKIEEFEYIGQRQTDNERVFLQNYHIPLYDQVKGLISEKINNIHIFAPYFDSNLSVINRFIKDFDPDSISVLLQNNTTNYPLTIKADARVINREICFKNKGDRRYHGKIFCFEGEKSEFLIYGSANCSSAALLNSVINGGNAEAIILDILPKHTFLKSIDEDVSINNNVANLETIAIESNQKRSNIPISFIEAVAVVDGVYIYLNCQKPITNLSISGINGEIIPNDNEIIAKWDIGILDKINSRVFNLIAQIEDNTYELKGWINNQEELTKNQLKTWKTLYNRLQEDPFISDYKNLIDLLEELLDRLVLNEDDLETIILKKGRRISIHEKTELDDTYEISDNIEDYYVSEEKLFKDRIYTNKIDVLGELIRQLLRPFEMVDIQQKTNMKESKAGRRSNTNATAEQIKRIDNIMQRFVNRFNKGLLSDAYVDSISEEVLFKNIKLFTAFLWNLLERKLNIEIIKSEHIIQQHFKILDFMIKYCKRNVIQHDLVIEIIPQVLAAILAHDILLDSNEDIEDIRYKRKMISDILSNIHELIIPIRENYRDFLEQSIRYLDVLKIGKDISIDTLCNILEKRFSFRTFNQYSKYVNSKYKLKTAIDVKEPRLELLCDIKYDVSFNLQQLTVLKEMITVEEWKECSYYVVEWINEAENNNISRYKLEFNENKKCIYKTDIYRTGNSIMQVKTGVDRHRIIEAEEKSDSQFMVEEFKIVSTIKY